MRLIDELVLETGFGRAELLKIIATAPARYKEYDIPKRRGGVRRIAHPARELKILQRFLLKTYLNGLPVHSSATGYLRKKNIYYNAVQHSNSNFLLKLDFKDFFPSIKVKDWEKAILQKHPDLIPSDEAQLFTRILFWGKKSTDPKCLSIGAPTSPSLSNAILYDLDVAIADICRAGESIYTRYADDITISSQKLDSLQEIKAEIENVLRRTKYPRLILNDEKTGIYSRGQRRMVTGLIITPRGEISLGRERKRCISSMLHKVTLGLLPDTEYAILKGLLGFAIANEPSFVTRLRSRYGSSAVDSVLRYRVPAHSDPIT